MVKHQSQLTSSSTRNLVSENSKHALLSLQFPNFNCICELCDCGCVTRQHHSKTCKRQAIRKHTIGGSKQHDKDCLLTHYQQTFKSPAKHTQRTLPLIPPPTPRDPNPPPMQFTTTQRSDFIRRGNVKKVEPIKFSANYEVSTDPVESKTAYIDSYVGHTNFPRIMPIKGGPPQRQECSLASFDSRTSHKEQFQNWSQEPVMAFTELPSFAGSILFPGNTLGELQSTSRHDFSGRQKVHADDVHESIPHTKVLEGNITLDGDFDHQTVHKQTYTDFGSGHKAPIYHPMPKIKSDGRGGIERKTQHMRDFPYQEDQPEAAIAIHPPEPTIRLNMDTRLDFYTEQRNKFKGHDTSVHKKRGIIRQSDDKYHPPSVKFETLTNNKADFQPKDVTKVNLVKACRPTSQTGREPGKFDDRTTNKKFYQDWGATPRVRYGSLQECIYIPSSDKMNGQSRTQSDFKAVKLNEPTMPFKPVEQPIESTGKQYFKTVHKETFIGHKPPVCKAQAYLMQQELLRQQRLRQENPTRGNTQTKNSRKKEMSLPMKVSA